MLDLQEFQQQCFLQILFIFFPPKTFDLNCYLVLVQYFGGIIIFFFVKSLLVLEFVYTQINTSKQIGGSLFLVGRLVSIPIGQIFRVFKHDICYSICIRLPFFSNQVISISENYNRCQQFQLKQSYYIELFSLICKFSQFNFLWRLGASLLDSTFPQFFVVQFVCQQHMIQIYFEAIRWCSESNQKCPGFICIPNYVFL
eukprot:TRINITY_DN5032_c0_g1_i5.p1 TRINITY_DN5032_c0_g1~~TRINITY_DN5032_c0_g1_i5.p1  ORF type:complete len:199 (-),score=-13.41 TRINITY_DN5032_c0_g1_i5:33-629(-)